MHGVARSADSLLSNDLAAQGFLAWELILAGMASDHIAKALSLDKTSSRRLCAAVMTAADVLGFLRASYPGCRVTARGRALVPPIPRFNGLLSFWSRDFICRYANQSHLDWFGKPPHAVVGRAMVDLLGPLWFGLCEPHIRMAMLSGTKRRFDVITSRADGSMVECLSYYVPNTGASGTIIGFFCYMIDMNQPGDAWS